MFLQLWYISLRYAAKHHYENSETSYSFLGLFAGYTLHFILHSILPHELVQCMYTLDKLLESTVDRRTDIWNILPEVNRGHSTLADALRCKLELL